MVGSPRIRMALFTALSALKKEANEKNIEIKSKKVLDFEKELETKELEELMNIARILITLYQSENHVGVKMLINRVRTVIEKKKEILSLDQDIKNLDWLHGFSSTRIGDPYKVDYVMQKAEEYLSSINVRAKIIYIASNPATYNPEGKTDRYLISPSDVLKQESYLGRIGTDQKWKALLNKRWFLADTVQEIREKLEYILKN